MTQEREMVLCVSRETMSNHPSQMEFSLRDRAALDDKNLYDENGQVTTDPAIGKMVDTRHHQQILPYVCFFRKTNGQPEVLRYFRGKAGAEKQLTGKISIGFGGHINRMPPPFEQTGVEWKDEVIYETQFHLFLAEEAIREAVNEELGLDIAILSKQQENRFFKRFNPAFRVSVADEAEDHPDISEVDRRHFGFFFIVEMPEAFWNKFTPEEGTISDIQWVPLTSLLEKSTNDRLELWSNILAHTLKVEMLSAKP